MGDWLQKRYRNTLSETQRIFTFPGMVTEAMNIIHTGKYDITDVFRKIKVCGGIAGDFKILRELGMQKWEKALGLLPDTIRGEYDSWLDEQNPPVKTIQRQKSG